MIGTAELLRAVALSARAVAAVEIANNIGSTSDDPESAPSQVQATGPILADQIASVQSPVAGQTLVGLSDPSVSFQSVAIQANGSVVETRIVDIVRQLAAQILMAEGAPVALTSPESAKAGNVPSDAADPATAASQDHRDLEQIVVARTGASLMAARTPPVDARGQSVAVDQRPGSISDKSAGTAGPRSDLASGDVLAVQVTAMGRAEHGGMSDISAKPSDAPLPDAATFETPEARALAQAQAHDPSEMRLLADLLTGALTNQNVHGEAGGIIASFILNAAMIPGWPPPRLPESIEEQVADLATHLAVSPEMSQADLMEYLAKFGVNEQLLERLRKAQLPPPTTLKVLGYLAVLMTAISTVFASLKEEVAQLVEELKKQGAEAEDAESIRERLYLR